MLTLILPFFGTRSDCFFVTRTDSTLSRYSPESFHFPVLTLILPFFGTRTDSTFSRYLPRFYHFPVLTFILPFFGTLSNSFSVIGRILLIPVLARILPFSGTDPNSAIFRYSFGQCFCTRMDSTFSRHSPRFYHFPVLTLILPFFGTRSDSYSILARILLYPGTRSNPSIFRY